MVRALWQQRARSRCALGRSQVVRQRILIPPFGGSSPPAPASYVVVFAHVLSRTQNVRQYAGFATRCVVSASQIRACRRRFRRPSLSAIFGISFSRDSTSRNRVSSRQISRQKGPPVSESLKCDRGAWPKLRNGSSGCESECHPLVGPHAGNPLQQPLDGQGARLSPLHDGL